MKIYAFAQTIAVIGLLLSTNVEAQEKKADKTKSRMVKVRVAVVDAQSKMVSNLLKDNFTLYENGIKQAIESLKYEQGNLSLGILTDTSASMRQHLPLVQKVALTLLKVVKDNDEVFLAQFKAEPELLKEFTNNKVELEKALGEMYAAGGSSLFDAIVAASDYTLNNGKNRRKALVVITDSVERNSGFDLKKTLEAVKKNDVPVYIVILPYVYTEPTAADRKLQAKMLVKNEEAAIRLAQFSGGEIFFPESLEGMDNALKRIGAALQSEYLIEYISDKKQDGQFRNLRVEVFSKDGVPLTAMTREGYFALK